MTDQLLAFLSALGLVLGLIISIGGQNAYLLRQGIKREHVGVIVAVFIASDVTLQAAGVLGIARLVEAVPIVESIARWLGAAFLVGYAFLSARRAWRGGGTLVPSEAPTEQQPTGALKVKTRTGTRKAALIGAIVVTWLNPHAIVETTVVIGSVSTQFGDDRLWFLAGGSIAAAIWFLAFGYGARLLGPLLRTERAWRILDASIAAIMLVIAVLLVLG